MDEAQIKKLIEEYLGQLPPKKQEFIMLSVQKEVDMYMFSVLRELQGRYSSGNMPDFIRNGEQGRESTPKQTLGDNWANKRDE